ncbi:hypothetical protein ABFU38_18825 [Xanthomonas campestris pv. raphani]
MTHEDLRDVPRIRATFNHLVTAFERYLAVPPQVMSEQYAPA